MVLKEERTVINGQEESDYNTTSLHFQCGANTDAEIPENLLLVQLTQEGHENVRLLMCKNIKKGDTLVSDS